MCVELRDFPRGGVKSCTSAVLIDADDFKAREPALLYGFVKKGFNSDQRGGRSERSFELTLDWASRSIPQPNDRGHGQWFGDIAHIRQREGDHRLPVRICDDIRRERFRLRVHTFVRCSERIPWEVF